MADTAHIYHHRVHYIIQEKYINMPYRKPNTHKQPLSIFKNISDLLISLNIFQSSMTPTWSACIHVLISEQVLLGLMNEHVSSVCIMMKIKPWKAFPYPLESLKLVTIKLFSGFLRWSALWKTTLKNPIIHLHLCLVFWASFPEVCAAVLGSRPSGGCSGGWDAS